MPMLTNQELEEPSQKNKEYQSVTGVSHLRLIKVTFSL